MRAYLGALSGLALAIAAVPASATIVVYDTPGAVQPDENVLLGTPVPSGNNAYGITNQTHTGVTFVGNEPLATPSNGQARIEAVDGGLSHLSFFLTDTTLGFKEVEFNISGTHATATSVLLSFYDQFGNTFGGTYAINNGQNYFSAKALDDQFITKVSFWLNGEVDGFEVEGDVDDVKQFRIGGVDGVPEPASWAMMIVGFGLVGATSRRRRTQAAVTA
jgi:hypothetical protein